MPHDGLSWLSQPAFLSTWDFFSRPLMVLLILFAALTSLAYWRQTYPGQRLLQIVVIWSLVSFSAIWYSDLEGWILTGDFLLLTLALLDVATVPRPSAFQVQRRTHKIVSLMERHPVKLRLSYSGHRSLSLTLRDDIPPEFQAEPEEHWAHCPAKSRITFQYHLQASRRGAFQQEYVYLRCPSRWGLWIRFIRLSCPQPLHVFPDLRQLSRYALLARTNRLGLLGVRRTRKIGQDHEFERLRDYTPDDNFKHIDWRTTARRNKLTVRDYQMSQSQRIVFLIDCGRMMCNRSGELSLLDHALNAALMLSFVALRQGDQVGLLAFADQVQAYLPPRGGMRHMNRLLHACFDRFPRLVESRYDLAFLHLARMCRRRSLVVLMTNVIDHVNAQQLESYLASTRQRHLALGVLLRDHALFDQIPASEPKESELYTAAAAAQILSWRTHVLKDLTRRGIFTLDVFPEQMTAQLINRYLEIKARHLL